MEFLEHKPNFKGMNLKSFLTNQALEPLQKKLNTFIEQYTELTLTNSNFNPLLSDEVTIIDRKVFTKSDFIRLPEEIQAQYRKFYTLSSALLPRPKGEQKQLNLDLEKAAFDFNMNVKGRFLRGFSVHYSITYRQTCELAFLVIDKYHVENQSNPFYSSHFRDSFYDNTPDHDFTDFEKLESLMAIQLRLAKF